MKNLKAFQGLEHLIIIKSLTPFYFTRAKFVNVLLGIHHLYSHDPQNPPLKSTEFRINPHYNADKIENDIGLIKLPKSVKYSGECTVADFAPPCEFLTYLCNEIVFIHLVITPSSYDF